ncbi:unnamed protein product [Phytomonas sp. EM1]|nr:unnamed protein product [Phytomonas sp. EM1]|eukprot:CCW63193.1 unnamed protein product [Phytomonas sp. isolate EM1]
MKRVENSERLNANKGAFWRQLIWRCFRALFPADDVSTACQRKVNGDISYAPFYLYPNQWPQGSGDAISLSENIFQDLLKIRLQWVASKLVQIIFILFIIAFLLVTVPTLY